MKTVITILLTSSLSLFASPYWVQVSSIKESSGVAKSFLIKIKQNGFNHDIIEADSRKKVFLGPFKSKKIARNALPKIRCKIARDAFIVGGSVKKAVATLEKKGVAIEDLSNASKKALQLLPKVVSPKPCLCIYDVHLLHKIELEEALAYYKKSSYYSFKE
ncbi:MAG: SPOR domain-containing protein [Campylobacterota bacterium]|nr:SPOR domain-containing protein [Campylobacterota bacterium]